MTIASSDVIFSHDPQRQMAAMKRCFGADMMNYYCCKPPKRKKYIFLNVTTSFLADNEPF